MHQLIKFLLKAIGYISLLSGMFGMQNVFAGELATVKQGVLDLRSQSLGEQLELRGEWDFFWNKLLTPATIASEGSHKTSMTVPGL